MVESTDVFVYLMSYKRFIRIMLFRKAVNGLLIGGVLVSLFAPQSAVLASERKEAAVILKVDELLNDVEECSIEAERSQLLITILKLLPEEQWRPLKSISIGNKVRTPRGLKDQDSIAINYRNIDSNEEFVAVFLHEIGHVVDLDVLVGSSKEKSTFKYLDGSPVPADDPSIDFYSISWEDSFSQNSTADVLDSVSEYGFTNPFEDFAEGYIFYLLHGKSFKFLSKYNNALKQKYNFIKNVAFKGLEFSYGDLFYKNDEIYDTTILFYDLEAFVAMMKFEKSKKQTISRMSYSRPPRYVRG